MVSAKRLLLDSDGTMNIAGKLSPQRDDMKAAIFDALTQAESQGDQETAAELLVILKTLQDARLTPRGVN